MAYYDVIEQMTLSEKARLMSGKTVWETMNYEHLGINSMFLSDGPHGLRRQEGPSDHLGLNKSLPATCFPTAATISNSWNVDLAETIGMCLGYEALVQNVQVLLGPGLNIKRSPLCGRNFEYFSEDPYISGKMAAAYIRGIQHQGVAACPKHFAANNQELRRMSNDSVMDERTFKEIYLTGFEIAVKEGKPQAIMSAYNKINGTYANENKELLIDILREQWGFEGIVISDWGGSNDHVLGVKNGSHLEMPSTGNVGASEIIEAVKTGALSENTLNQRVNELLQVIMDVTRKCDEEVGAYDEQVHHEIAYLAALDSLVLLKNEGHILPLKGREQVAFIGDFFIHPRYQGAGSSVVNPTRLESVVDILEQNKDISYKFAPGFQGGKGFNRDLVNQAVEIAKSAKYVIVSLGLDDISETEGEDRTHLKIPDHQVALLNEIKAVNDNIIVVLFGGGVIEMPWISQIKGLLNAYLPGQAGAKVIVEILFGKANPSGKLCETYPMRQADTPCNLYYPGFEVTSEYREGLYVGYRYYQTKGIEVLFPFGFGLSYTEFTYSDLMISERTVVVTITNSGKYDGAEIVQLYVSRQSTEIFRPKRELKGFAKVFLKSGESREVEILLDDYAFRYYDMEAKCFLVEKGDYFIQVGASATDIRLEMNMSIDGTSPVIQYNTEKLAPYFTGNIQDISDSQFEALLNRKIPEHNWDTSKPLTYNDSISQLYYAKSIFAKLAYAILNGIMKKSKKTGKPNLNVIFIFYIPFRGVVKMTNGKFTKEMAEAVIKIINGHLFKGIGSFIKSIWIKHK